MMTRRLLKIDKPARNSVGRVKAALASARIAAANGVRVPRRGLSVVSWSAGAEAVMVAVAEDEVDGGSRLQGVLGAHVESGVVEG